MTSIFQYSRQNTDEEPEEVPQIFKAIKEQKTKQSSSPVNSIEKKQPVFPVEKNNIVAPEEDNIPVNTLGTNNLAAPVEENNPESIKLPEENVQNDEEIAQDIADAEAYEKETPFESAKRNVLSYGARAAEGFFGGIGSFLNLLTPELFEPMEELGGKTPYEIGARFPGAGDLREFTKSKTGKYLEPKGETSKILQETVSDIGSMFSTPGLAFLSKLALPVGGQITKQVLKKSGASERNQELGKLGFMALASLANLGNARGAAGEALRDAENMIPQGMRFSAQPTEHALANIRRSNWFTTGRTPAKGPAMDEIARIEAQIQNGTIDAHVAMQLRRDINEARRNLGGFQLNPIADRAGARRYLDQVDDALLESFQHYGNNVNPHWLRDYQLANQAWGITQRSRLISDLVEKHAKPLQSQMAKNLFYAASPVLASSLPSAALAVPGALAIGKTIQIMNRMMHSSVLRSHYLNVIRLTSQGLLPQVVKEIEKFDTEASKMEAKKANSRRD
jgi:hypothetical protein